MNISCKKTLILGLGFALFGAACQNVPEVYKGAMEIPHPEVVQTSSVNHAISFSEGSSGLSQEEKAALENFLYAQGVQYGDELILEFAQTDRNWMAKMDSITGFLKTRGVWIDYAGQTAEISNPATASLIVNRYSATTPDCLALSRESFVPTELEKDKIFGCVTAHNLAAMVAKPQHLREGAPDSLPYTYASVRALQLFRARTGRTYLTGFLPPTEVIVSEDLAEAK